MPATRQGEPVRFLTVAQRTAAVVLSRGPATCKVIAFPMRSGGTSLRTVGKDCVLIKGKSVFPRGSFPACLVVACGRPSRQGCHGDAVPGAGRSPRERLRMSAAMSPHVHAHRRWVQPAGLRTRALPRWSVASDAAQTSGELVPISRSLLPQGDKEQDPGRCCRRFPS